MSFKKREKVKGLKTILDFLKEQTAGFLFRGIQTNTASPANAVSERTFSAIACTCNQKLYEDKQHTEET